ncbi:hypothetical protein BYT27DRAFT_7180339, partial [Phlegmacium glaucopus]
MADALAPWFLDYVLSVSETCGANISNLQPHAKGRKVQITEFLTYGSETEDSLLWARISDKQYIIPIKFTKEAVAQYARQKYITSKRFTQHKTAVITIKNFRLIFTRVPLGTLGTMSSQPSLAIECLWFSVLGSSGEAIFGNPKPITDHSDLHLWSECLKRDGGAGNILKDRKIHQQSNDLAGAAPSPTALPQRPRSPVLRPDIHQSMPCAPNNLSITAYMNKWQFIERTHAYRRLPQVINAPPDGTVCFFNDPVTSNLKNGGAPNSQQCSLEAEPNSSNNAFSSSIPAPTPAQRMKTSNMLELRSCDDLMVQQRKIPRPTSPEPHDHKDPIRILAPNSDVSSQSQSISQTQSCRGSQGLLLGIMVDLERGEYPFLNLMRVREILGRTYRL